MKPVSWRRRGKERSSEASLDRRIASEWRATLDALTDLVMLLDSEARVLRVNRTAEIWGLGRLAQLPGRHFHDVLHPRCSDADDCYLLERWRRLREGSLSSRRSGALLERDFEDPWLGLRVRLNARLVDGETPAEAGAAFAVFVLRDVTVYHHRQVALTRSGWVESAGHLARGLAHEIGNPLSAIKTSVQVLLGNYDRFPREKKQAYLHRVAEAAERIRAILDRLKRHQQWRVSDLVELPVRPALQNAAMLFAGEASERGVELRFEAPAPDLRLRGDAEALEILLTILLTNALEACEDGGHVVLSSRREGDFVLIEVQDDGCGIPGDKVEMVFRSFYTTKPGSAGIGLSHAHYLAEQMRGRLGIRSAEGEGTTVTLVLEAP